MKTVDVIIPTYKPGKKLVKIIEMLENQTYKIGTIYLINTEKQYFDEFDKLGVLGRYNNIVVKHITKTEFDHGNTRADGVKMSKADYFVCMTDDAIPVDNMLIEKLVSPLYSGEASVSYARQCTRKSAPLVERYTRHFNYPSVSSIKSKEDASRLGIKTYFCSDVCAAYDRNVYEELGGFVNKTIFNEDMIMAYKIINSGRNIAYVSEAKVLHYHNYTNMQQLRRNFDLGVSHKQYNNIFDNVPPAKEGAKMVMDTTKYLIRKKRYLSVGGLYITSAFKYIGYRLGKIYDKLPRKAVIWLSMNKNYWI